MPRPPRPLLSAAVLLRQGLDTGPAETRRLAVLVAEGDPVRRQRLLGVLEGAGERAFGAASWAEAQGMLGRTAFDAVLLALDLPQAGRLSAGRAVRGWPPPVSALPLLALQDGMTRVQEKDWRDAGFDALLRWPEDVADLPALLREVVTRLTPPLPVDPAIRAALLEQHGEAALAARDLAALQEIGAQMAVLRGAEDAAAAQPAAAAIAAACEAIGALPAAAAARAAGLDFPRGQEALVNALAAAGRAIRLAGRGR